MYQLLYVSNPFQENHGTNGWDVLTFIIAAIFIILFLFGKIYLYFFDRDEPKPEPVIIDYRKDLFYDPRTAEYYDDEDLEGNLDGLDNLKDPI
jgi:hypothetical protein